MKILEVKNNLVKISYTAKDNLVISGFVIIEDRQSPYVGQVMSLKADSGINYAIVKLLFTFNQEGVVKNYNGTIPELDANLTKLSAAELLDILPIEVPFMAGKLAQQDFILNIDYSTFDKNLLICSDNVENTDTLLSNIAKRITENNDKSIIFDITGTIEAENKLVFGKDFKLPLNYDTINFIYEHDLNDVEPTSKAVIQDILLEVQEYSRTLLEQFIPFDLFIAVIDSQAKKLQLPELALLKNRLMKYKNDNAFAQEAKEIHSLRASVRANLSTLLDISGAESDLQNLIISTVYSELTNLDLFIYSLVEINNENADKRLLKKILTNNKIFTSVVCPHNYRYIHDLKELASNMFLFAPQTIQHDFSSYNVFLNKLNPDECIVYGKATQHIPLIVEVMPVEALEEYQKTFAQKAAENIVEEDSFSEASDTFSENDMMDDAEAPMAEPETVSEPPLEPIEDGADSENENDEELNSTENNDSENPEEAVQEEEAEDNSDLETNADSDEEPVSEAEASEEDPNVEAEQSEETEQNILEPIDEEELVVTTEDSLPEESLEFQEDVMIEELPDDNLQEPPLVQTDENMEILEEAPAPEISLDETPLEQGGAQAEQQDGLTEDDLNFIDNLNEPETQEELIVESDVQHDTEPQNQVPDAEEFVENSEEPEFIDSNESNSYEVSDASDFIDMLEAADDTSEENVLGEEQPPVVPIYPADEDTPVTGEAQMYEPGDKVAHPKYGEGIVEKMVKFGNKVLCSINFANGRRLLDPTISQLSK